MFVDCLIVIIALGPFHMDDSGCCSSCGTAHVSLIRNIGSLHSLPIRNLEYTITNPNVRKFINYLFVEYSYFDKESLNPDDRYILYCLSYTNTHNTECHNLIPCKEGSFFFLDSFHTSQGKENCQRVWYDFYFLT